VDRLDDILELRRTEVSDGKFEPPLDLPVGLFRKAYRARRANAFQPPGNIDAVAHQVAVGLLDDVAEMDADAKRDAALGRHAGVAFDHAVLHLDGAAYGVDHAAKFDQAAIAGALDDPTVMDGNCGVDQIAPQRPESRQRAVLVGASEPAVADHVRDKDRCNLPGFGHGAPLRIIQNSTRAGWRRHMNRGRHGDLHCGCQLDAQKR
jgi:hypothetical protein